jgi:hypothetical protein
MAKDALEDRLMTAVMNDYPEVYRQVQKASENAHIPDWVLAGSKPFTMLNLMISTEYFQL